MKAVLQLYFYGKKGLEYKALLKSEQGQNINLIFIDKNPISVLSPILVIQILS